MSKRERNVWIVVIGVGLAALISLFAWAVVTDADASWINIVTILVAVLSGSAGFRVLWLQARAPRE